MRIATTARFLSASLVVLLAWCSAGVQASGEEDDACHMLRGGDASFLMQCGKQLHSFSLVLRDLSRTVGSDGNGKFGFFCPIELMCEGQPSIVGTFIDQTAWLGSAKDENAAFELIQNSALRLPDTHGDVDLLALRTICGAFGTDVAGIPGLAVCFQLPGAPMSAIAVVAADETVGFVLIFLQNDTDWATLHEKVLKKLPRFEIERATGDKDLLRWMR